MTSWVDVFGIRFINKKKIGLNTYYFCAVWLVILTSFTSQLWQVENALCKGGWYLYKLHLIRSH